MRIRQFLTLITSIMLKRIFFFLFLIVSQALAGQKATVTVETRNILTYPYNDPSPLPLITEGRPEIYPYFRFDGYSLKGQMQQWKVVKLENDYVEVWIMPTDGGKVWGAIEKSTGKEFIYRNEVMKYRNISMRGPWTSGGVEFNFGYIGHNPSTCVPVDYKTVENPDGSVSCFVGSLDLPSRTKWVVEVRLPRDKAYFETYAFWNNPTPLPQTYYNWMTGAAVVTNDLEFSYPGSGQIGHGGEWGPWPIDEKGRNLAWYKNNNFGSSKSYHVVGEYNDFMGGYYHNSNFGFGHWALYDEVPGQKLWLWSLARDGGIWEDLLTDTDGQYMEFQAGRMFNQYGGTSAFKTPISQTPFNPGLTDRWHEIWFPVKDIGGIKDVSPIGVLNVDAVGGKLQIGINALADAQGKITVKSGGKVVFTDEKKFKPMDVYKTSVALNTNEDYEVSVEGMDLKYSPSKRIILKRPFISEMPKNITTGASLYQEAMQNKEERNYVKAEGLFKSCLQKDPLYIDAMAGLIEIYYRKMQYDSALYFANNALQLDTYHPATNFFAGITYMATGDLEDAVESLGWAARSPEYRSTAYAWMATIELLMNNKELTEHYAKLALDYERTNINALHVLAVLHRKSGQAVLADKYIQTLSSIDPLSHFADFERYLLHKSADDLSRFTSTITNEMPYQTYLELSLIYFDMGMKDDALSVLDKAPFQPLISVWKAYINGDASMLKEVADASPDFVFPYRTETVKALQWAMSENNNWKFKYYLALAYGGIYRDDDCLKLMLACGQEPDYAPFYIARADLVAATDSVQQLKDLEMARKILPDDWRATSKLIDYYEGKHDYKMALSLSEEAYKKHRDNSEVGIQYVIALINNKEYAKSVKLLEGMTILPFEGARAGKMIYDEACLSLAMDYIQSRKYSSAIKMIDKSRLWPENLGVGKPYDVDTRIQDYLAVYCLGKMNKTAGTDELRKSIVSYESGRRRYPSFNVILAIKTLQAEGKSAEADEIISKMEDSSNPVRKWIVAAAENDQAAMASLEKQFGPNQRFEVIKRVLEVTSK
jgi:tetratricopeptide (TPR) repeat protein